MLFADYIIKEKGKLFYDVALNECYNNGVSLEEHLTELYVVWNKLYNLD